MRLKLLCGVCVVLLLTGSTDFVADAQRRRAARRQQPLKICFDPTSPCRTTATFGAHDLPFRIPANAVIWESEEFYAVMLKSMRVTEDYNCESFIPEAERLEAQRLFPRRKVFTSRCAEPGELYYTGIADKQRFMAVYAGLTRAEAERVLGSVKATGKYPGANIRRMRAGFNGT